MQRRHNRLKSIRGEAAVRHLRQFRAKVRQNVVFEFDNICQDTSDHIMRDSGSRYCHRAESTLSRLKAKYLEMFSYGEHEVLRLEQEFLEECDED